MISKSLIEELTHKYQTTQVNVAREYCQHLFLSYFYQKKKSDRLLFKGGTALRFIYNSPRFSEDLDFTTYNMAMRQIETIFIDSINDIAQTGIGVELEEAKIASGGYLAIARFTFLDFKQTIQIEASMRSKKLKIASEVNLVNSDYIPSYNIVSLAEKDLIEEKIRALLDRAKPRDFFDIYFLLRANLSTPKNSLSLNKVLKKLEKTKIDFKRELRIFLPKSHHNILKDFKNILKRELNKYGKRNLRYKTEDR
ncbi:MAG: nucleotidyl transferase AbiEii/AbiGii toxin family protein [Candidatus Omnitrophica bacterium]|nr:nucleotidyl transferase AbiEii/AbiGii toxin family protein [Candidatus Omnitrophota bacterium]